MLKPGKPFVAATPDVFCLQEDGHCCDIG